MPLAQSQVGLHSSHSFFNVFIETRIACPQCPQYDRKHRLPAIALRCANATKSEPANAADASPKSQGTTCNRSDGMLFLALCQARCIARQINRRIVAGCIALMPCQFIDDHYLRPIA